MEDTLFTKIIKGEVPSYKIYEDDKTFAFLDINPLAPGHVLVVPRVPVEFIWDLEPEDYQAVMATVQKVGKRLRDVMEAPFVGVEVIGIDVPHAHVHVVPFTTIRDMKRDGAPGGVPNHTELEEIAKKVRFF